ncbi:MAG: protein kinase domain-containing protein [Fimbriiglobus sp.]
MTPPADAAGMAELIARLGLAEESVVTDFVVELGDKKGPAEPLVRLMERRGHLTPFQTAKLLKGEADGYFLGGFRILYRIASGSFGKVYRGDDPQTGQIVAVKVLRKKWLDDDDKRGHRIAQFEREGRIGLSLQHPNIVQILNVGQDQHTGSHFIVMEFVEGGNLRDILNIRKTVAVPDAMKIMEECAAGLAHAYEKGLTHRDIKPSNILLGTDGVAKLVDFGLAEANVPARPAAPAGPPNAKVVKQLKGAKKEKEEEPAERTLDYAGLEKATGVKSGDVRSDIYFLGHVLFEMIAGDPLMERTKNQRAATEKRRYELVEPAFSRLAVEMGLPDPVRRVIAKAIALEPHHRYQTPEPFLDALRAARAELAAADAPSHSGDDDAAEPIAALRSLPRAQVPVRATGPATVVVVEKHPKLQDVFRDRLAKLGLRVLMTADPAPVLKRYKQQPFHAAVVDAGTVGPDGLTCFRQLLAAAAAGNHALAGVLIVNEGEEAMAAEFAADTRAVVLPRPVTIRQLADALANLMPELQPPPGAIGASGTVPINATDRTPPVGG